MTGGFWKEQNGWWKVALSLPQMDWAEAARRVRSLVRSVPEARALNAQDREDMAQDILAKLVAPDGPRIRLGHVDTPAHYLARMVRNHLLNGWDRDRTEWKALGRRAEAAAQPRDLRPDRQAEWAERCAKARFIVNHVVSAADRKALWWFYKDGLPVRAIAERLGVSEVAALQRLCRARKRVKAEFEK
jgi:RNA polymerase sigma factor (sigma-70 family)